MGANAVFLLQECDFSPIALAFIAKKKKKGSHPGNIQNSCINQPGTAGCQIDWKKENLNSWADQLVISIHLVSFQS